jgi:hypothetical protein
MGADDLAVSGHVDKNIDPVDGCVPKINPRVIISFIIKL